MTAQDLIERYAHAVVRRLPPDRRADIRMELTALLSEAVAERTSTGEPEPAAAEAVITGFGSPEVVAERYHTAVPVVEPRDTRLFKKVIAIGLAALCVLAVSVVLSDPLAQSEPGFGQRIVDETALAGLQYIGALLLVFWGMGIWHRRAASRTWSARTLPPVPDPDAVNRPLTALAILFWSAGLGVLVLGPATLFATLSGGAAPNALLSAFAYDADFQSSRANILWAALAISIAIQAWPVVTGRRSSSWHRIEAVASILLGLLLYAIILAGNIFAQEPANEIMKLAMAVFAGWALIEGVATLMRERQRGRDRAVGSPSA